MPAITYGVDQGDKVGNFVIENLDLTQNIISKK